MRLRHPPGRGGRLWLEHRLQVATTGADLLDKKRRALVQEHRGLRVLARQTAAAWEESAREAETWVNRAAVMAGEEKVQMMVVAHPLAEVTVRWRSSMGVTFASEAHVELGIPPAPGSGGSAAADVALSAARSAVAAAVKDAAAQSALKRITAELAVTSRRERALERRWLPALSAAAAALSNTLDELEREEATRALWVKKRRQRPGR